MSGPTLWDKLVTFGDPTKQEGRVVARARMAYFERASTEGDGYEAAGVGRRLINWLGGRSGPNAQVASGLLRSRDRHRDLCRNNPWAKRAAQAITTHTVGHGLMVEFKARKEGVATREAVAEFVNELWSEWYESTACDWDNKRDGYMQQAATLNETARKGDSFIRARWLPGSSDAKVPLKLQLVPPEMCDESKTENYNGNVRVVQGVEFTNGLRSNYWMFPEHPADLVPAFDITSRPVPAVDVAHVYREDEIGQVRGMPWGHACIVPLKQLGDYSDAYMFRQQLANCFAGFVHDTDAPSLNPANGSKAVLPDSMEPGAMLGLPAGKKVTFNKPPDAGDYGPFVKDKLYEIATGYGITFPMLTGRYEELNFTSGRMGYMDVAKNIDDWRWLMLVPQMMERIIGWFLEAVELKHGIDTSQLYAEITPPKRELMDPPREVPAEIKAVRAGLWSMQESWRSRGMRPKRVVAEIKQHNEMLDKAGIVLDTDPRKVNAQGAAQAPEKTENPDDSEADD